MNPVTEPTLIDLARAPPFELGAMSVRPAVREIAVGDQRTVLEPRVMQVLVALAERREEVVSRDALTSLCWGGRAVGEDAITRCIAAIRRLADGCFTVETIPRVGYRLAVSDAPVLEIDEAPAPILAVLPFDNLSDDPQMLYFSDGVSEEILQTVVQTTDIKVIGRTSSFQFRGAEKATRNVATELGCTHLLDGSVRRSGDRVRVLASLIACEDQTTLWSDSFERDLSDAFALQDEIAARVAATLQATFAPSPLLGPIDGTAYDLYLQARASSPGRFGSFDASLLRQATQRAPMFSQAWAALAMTCALAGDAREEASQAAHQALALDPSSGTAFAALALLEPVCGRFTACEALFGQALRAAPDDPVSLEKYSRWLHTVGRTDAAMEAIGRAYASDPLYHQGANWYGVLLAQKGRTGEAFEIWERGLARWPDYASFRINILETAMLVGDWARAEQVLAEAASRTIDNPALIDLLERVRRRRQPEAQASEWALARLDSQLAETGTVSLNALEFACQRGLADAAYAFLARASFEHLFRPGGRLLPGDYGLHSLFNVGGVLRQDARFAGLCVRLGLADYWIDTDCWPDFAPHAPYDFKGECLRLRAARPA